MSGKLIKALKFMKRDFDKLQKTKQKDIWQEDDDLIYLLGEKLIDKSEDIDKFTEVEKTFYLCKIFYDEVESSGDFYSVYTSDVGQYTYDMEEYFKTIGAEEISKIINKVNKLFKKRLPSDYDERNEYINEIYEKIEEKMEKYYNEYSQYSERLYDLLYNYAINNKEEFKNID